MNLPPNRRGMAMVVAISLIGLIGIALAGLTQQVASNVRRVRLQTESAQARQILLAATRELVSNPDAQFALPAELVKSGAKVKITAVTGETDRHVFQIDASFGGASLSESLTLSRSSNGWSIAYAQLQ